MQQYETDTIMLVDSETLQRITIAQYLRECGYRVIEAISPEEAMQALSAHAIDVVVVDVDLNGANGFKLSAIIREKFEQTRTILTHSLAKKADIAGDLCEDGPLDRPYHPQQLVDRIKRLKRGQ